MYEIVLERWFLTMWFVLAAGCGGLSIRENAGAEAGIGGSRAGAGAGGVSKGGDPSTMIGSSAGGGSAMIGSSTGGGSAMIGGDGLQHLTTPPGVFDPGEVYIWGSLDVGICGRDALTTWWEPDRVQTGFGCETSSSPHASVVDPQSGQLVYAQFHADSPGGLWQLASFTPDGDGKSSYPTAPAANDPILDASCSHDMKFWADPSGKGVLFHCEDDCVDSACGYVWQSGEQLSMAVGCKLLHLGFDDRMLVECNASGVSIQDPDGNVMSLDDPDYWLYEVDEGLIRATPQGFWLVHTGQTALERYSAGFDGSVTIDGVYPLPSLAEFTPQNCALDAMGAAYCLVTQLTADGNHEIVRAELGASSFTVVYDENANPPVKLPEYGLFTGP